MTNTPHITRHNAAYFKNLSNLDMVFVELSVNSEPMSLYPNVPGRMNEIEVEPVAPTTDRTLASSDTNIATRYDAISMAVVIVIKRLPVSGTSCGWLFDSSTTSCSASRVSCSSIGIPCSSLDASLLFVRSPSCATSFLLSSM